MSRPVSSTNRWRWMQEPLLHFILIGAIIFAIWFCYGKREATEEGRTGISRKITVAETKLKELHQQFIQNEGHSPSHAELTKAADDWVHEEILYREGLRAGLDRNDPIIRQRLAKLMQWYLVGAGAGGEPGDAELRRHFEANEERYRSTNGGLAFEQIFFSTARRGSTAETDARMTLRSFEAGKITGIEVAIGHGDSLGGDKAQEELQRGKPDDLAAKFGMPFISLIQKLPFDRWSGPYETPLGWHVVKHLKPSNPTFDEMRGQIRSEIISARGNATPEAAYSGLLKRYDVEIGSLPEVQK